ncbi:MAG: NUDIX hydrolase [Elusimicrobiota bacterium]|nr:NUDIX hydrolase [Elusimicrobiota bacterium]
MIEKLIKSKKIYGGKILSFYVDDVSLPNGKIAEREYIRQPQAAAVIPIISRQKIVLVKQYRYPIKKVTYEIPAGKLDDGEKAIDCIKRELAEETGFTSHNIKKLISFYPSTAFSTEKLHIFVAKNLKKVKAHPDEDEFIEPVIIDYKKALKWIESGKIKDAKTLIGLLYYFKKFLS